jgi:3-oxoacyl-[acyl-carrier protein] reductase
MTALELPLSLTLADLHEGNEARHRYRITAALVDAFVAAFDDRSPVHIDEAFARRRGFETRVSHGAILNGFLSHFVGMRFPGATALLLSAEMRYAAACYIGDEVELTARVAHRSESAGTVLLTLTFHSLTRDLPVAVGKALVRVAS